MAPLTFPNEKQMVSSEESGPAAAWGGGCGGLGFWGAVRGAWGASAPCKRQVRGETTRSLFRGWGFFVVFSLMRGGSEDSFLFKMWGALFSREPRGAAARRRVGPALGERGVKRPPGPAPSASPGGGHQDLARPTTGACLLVPGVGGSPIHRSLPPLRFGAISPQRAGGKGAFLDWKFPADPRLENKRILRSRKQRAGI